MTPHKSTAYTTTQTMKVFACALLIIALPRDGEALQCYVGAETAGSAISLPPFPCGNKSCEKDHVDHVDAVIRKCADGHYEEGCNSNTILSVTNTVCFCNSDLCNSSNFLAVCLPLLVLSYILRQFL